MRGQSEQMSMHEQVVGAYLLMTRKARYRPAAPSDGLGSITMPEAELIVEDEAATYARRWRRDEDRGTYDIGSPDFDGRIALVLTVEAARLICGVTYPAAATLLRLAADELDRLEVSPD